MQNYETLTATNIADYIKDNRTNLVKTYFQYADVFTQEQKQMMAFLQAAVVSCYKVFPEDVERLDECIKKYIQLKI